MENTKKIEMIKKLENLVAFQKDCLITGDWDDYDRVVTEIEKLERALTDN